MCTAYSEGKNAKNYRMDGEDENLAHFSWSNDIKYPGTYSSRQYKSLYH